MIIALASSPALRLAARPSRVERGARTASARPPVAAMVPRSSASSSAAMTPKSVVVGSSLRLRSSSSSFILPCSSPPRAASRRQRPRSAEASAVTTAEATSPPTRYYATDRWRRGPKHPGQGGGEDAEEEFSSPSTFYPEREKVGVALPLLSSSGTNSDGDPTALELPLAVESPMDDPTLANPLQRLNRMSTGWMGVIFECDGVTLPATPQLHDAAWLAVADAEGKPRPKRWQLRRADGMKGEQAVSEAFHWARAPAEVRRLARAKEEAYDSAAKKEEETEEEGNAAAVAAAAKVLLPSSSNTSSSAAAAAAVASSSSSPSSSTAVAAPPTSSSAPEQKKRAKIFPVPGVTRFLETLAAHGVPAALASPERLERLEKTLAAAGLERAFAAVIAGDDVARCRPDAEAYLLAAARLGRPPSRCVLIGNSNASVEAARDAGMAVVAVAPRSASDAASAAQAAAVAAGADAETAALAGRAAAAAAEASAGGPRAYELGAADLVVRGGLDEITMADLKVLFANEAAVEGRVSSGSSRSENDSSSEDSFDDLDSRASPWSMSSPPFSSSAGSSDYGGLFEDSLGSDDDDDRDEDEEGDADDDWRRRSRELQLRR